MHSGGGHFAVGHVFFLYNEGAKHVVILAATGRHVYLARVTWFIDMSSKRVVVMTMAHRVVTCVNDTSQEGQNGTNVAGSKIIT